jgi:polyhydroxyalkanoate synthase
MSATHRPDNVPVASPYIAHDPEAFARNFAKAVEQGGRALAAYLKPREKGELAETITDSTTDLVKTLTKVGEYWAADPTRMLEAQTRLFASYLAVSQAAMARAAGEKAAAVEPKPGDKRFKDPDLGREPDLQRAEAVLPGHRAMGRGLGQGRRARSPHPQQGALLPRPDQ